MEVASLWNTFAFGIGWRLGDCVPWFHHVGDTTDLAGNLDCRESLFKVSTSDLDSMSDFIASFSPGRQRYIREDIQIESIRESNVQPRGILRNPEPESESAKSNTVRAKSIPQLTELFGEKFLTKNSTRTPSRESHNRTSLEKSGQEEKKKIKEQKTVVAFGRTTKVDDSIPVSP